MFSRVELPRGKDGRFGKEVKNLGLKKILATALLSAAAGYLLHKPKPIYLTVTVDETTPPGPLFERVGVKHYSSYHFHDPSMK